MTRLKKVFLGSNPKVTLGRCFILALTSFLIFGFWLRPVRVVGISMEPTLPDGGLRLVDILRYRNHPPRAGDIVVIAMPGGKAFYMKRVIGTPGETLSFVDGQLYINGARMLEPYIGVAGHWQMPPTLVPENHFFVAGDNRTTSFVGHTLGIVERSRITGALLQ